jgi:hypothetical protein
VSSTYEDLKLHRAHVIRELRKAGIFVDPMEDWTADAEEPKKFSQARLEGCDFCVLLVGLRRGFVPPGEQRSVTQLEYQAALDREMDVLVYLLDEDAPWPHRFVDLDRDPALTEWRRSLAERHGRELFAYEPTSIDIAPAITRWVDKQYRKSAKVGEDWVQLISGLLDLPKNQPDTWAVAAGLLPHALEGAKRAYQTGSWRSATGVATPSRLELSSPVKTVVAGAREYLGAMRATFERTCFVIAPFGRKEVVDQYGVKRAIDFDAIYEEILKPAIAAVHLPDTVPGPLVPLRVDDLIVGTVSEEQFRYLEYSRIVVADITGLNANVLYELGVRHHARASGTVILRQPGFLVPFDISAVKVFPYETGDIAASRQLIQRVLEETLRRDITDSPQHRADLLPGSGA